MIYDKLIKKEATLAVIGLGYVGLPIALEFAKKIKVIGLAIRSKKKMIRYVLNPMELVTTFEFNSIRQVSHTKT